jgi:hypothetical protein
MPDPLSVSDIADVSNVVIIKVFLLLFNFFFVVESLLVHVGRATVNRQ